jgi:hypothetical protein
LLDVEKTGREVAAIYNKVLGHSVRALESESKCLMKSTA